MDYVTYANEYIVELRGAAVRPHPTDDLGGLVGGLSGNLPSRGQPWILTGVNSGPVRISVERREQEPGDTVDGWEDVVEFTCRVAEPGVVAAGMWADAPDPRFSLDPPRRRLVPAAGARAPS